LNLSFILNCCVFEYYCFTQNQATVGLLKNKRTYLLTSIIVKLPVVFSKVRCSSSHLINSGKANNNITLNLLWEISKVILPWARILHKSKANVRHATKVEQLSRSTLLRDKVACFTLKVAQLLMSCTANLLDRNRLYSRQLCCTTKWS